MTRPCSQSQLDSGQEMVLPPDATVSARPPNIPQLCVRVAVAFGLGTCGVLGTCHTWAGSVAEGYINIYTNLHLGKTDEGSGGEAELVGWVGRRYVT